MAVARSLAEASRLTSSVRSLALRASADLQCRNIMCEKVGGACACRLALTLQRLSGLTSVDVADNALGVLPSSLWEHGGLHHLDLSGNELGEWPEGLAACAEGGRLPDRR